MNRILRNGCILTLAIGVLIAAVIIGINLYDTHEEESMVFAYKQQNDYIIEITEHESSNHWCEDRFYKFFQDGTGLYLRIADHEDLSCSLGPSECGLSDGVDTVHFVYTILSGAIVFPLAEDQAPEYDTIFVDRNTYTITVGDDYIGNEREIDYNSSKIRSLFSAVDVNKCPQ